jgi:hypothetical protein
MSQLEQVRQMCISVVSKHVNAGVMRSVEATTRADTAKLIAAEIAALELPISSQLVLAWVWTPVCQIFVVPMAFGKRIQR